MVSYAVDSPPLSFVCIMSLSSRVRCLLLLAATTIFAACEDPYEIRARLAVVEDTLTIASLTDTLAAPTALVALNIAQTTGIDDEGLAIRRPVGTRLTLGLIFDVALIVGGDSVVFLPPRMVVSTLGSTHRVGLRVDTVAFESIRRALGSGYAFDSVAVTAREGDVVSIASQHPQCRQEFSPELYAKVEVLDIDAVSKQAVLRVRVDPNCGFRSFADGVPRS